AEQDEADAQALYSILEEQVLPAYYERDEAGLPHRWIGLMRESIAELGPRYGTARMVAEDVERLYLPAHEGELRAASRVAYAGGGGAPTPSAPPPPRPQAAAAAVCMRSGERSRTNRLVPSVQIGRPKIRPSQPTGPIRRTIATSRLKTAHQRGKVRVRHATIATKASGRIAASSAQTKNASPR